MNKFIIEGGHSLVGEVRVSGAKNAALPILAATALANEPCCIRDVPDIQDVRVMMAILRAIGIEVEVRESSADSGLSLLVEPRGLASTEVPDYLMREMRSSIMLMGALLGRLGRVKVSYPGGCAIGPRPIDLHLRGLRMLGAKVTERSGYIYGETPNGLRGTEIHLDFPSVGATENIMMAAVTARGRTVIKNAAKEPEIVDLQNFLNELGAEVRGAGTDCIRIEGIRELGGAKHTVIPDRIEAGTFMIAAAITGGDIQITNVITEHFEAATSKLRETGVELIDGGNFIRVRASERPLSVDVKTLPYPGYPTDMQPQIMALMTIARGTSIVSETVYENRLKHAEELRRLGANIKVEGRTAIIKGVNNLYGAPVRATDLRSGAALVLAGLAAEDRTVVEDIGHVDRGYERLEKKLSQLGAVIIRT